MAWLAVKPWVYIVQDAKGEKESVQYPYRVHSAL